MRGASKVLAGVAISLLTVSCSASPHLGSSAQPSTWRSATPSLIDEPARLSPPPGSTRTPPSFTPQPNVNTNVDAPPEIPGWRRDWSDDFSGPLEANWGAYGWTRQVPTGGAMGVYKPDNVFVEDGRLKLRTWYRGGEWTSAGVSSGKGFTAAEGRWEFRARFERAKGIGYACLLWPSDNSWPPEVDVLEGRVNGPDQMFAYHWGRENHQELRFTNVYDMQQWHTYGVIVESDKLTVLRDGMPWEQVDLTEPVGKQLWLGFQTGAMDPNGSAKQWETVDGAVPGPLTPAISHIEIDWVAHYVKSQ